MEDICVALLFCPIWPAYLTEPHMPHVSFLGQPAAAHSQSFSPRLWEDLRGHIETNIKKTPLWL